MTCRVIAAVLLLLLAAAPVMRAEEPSVGQAPQPMRELAAAIQGKSAGFIRGEIVRRFGQPQRDVGSGFRIEQWDVAGGVLTFHQTLGPTFADKKTGTTIHLLKSVNRAGANVIQSYEMTTLPDPANHGNRFWIGNLGFGPKNEYLFRDSEQNLNERGKPNGNFFLAHPRGSYRLSYAEGIGPDTPLESLAEGALVARIVFTSTAGGAQTEFSITSSGQGRRLSFTAASPPPFVMDTSWRDTGLPTGGNDR